MEFKCYRCESTHQLMIQEKMDKDTGEVIEKKCVCVRCNDKIVTTNSPDIANAINYKPEY